MSAQPRVTSREEPAPRRTVDVSDLPEETFGTSSVMWWGVLCFILIEGTTLGVSVGSYLYLSGVARDWPPPRTELPGLLVPALKVLAMLVNTVPVVLSARAARGWRFAEMRRWLTLAAVGGLVVVVLQALEFSTAHTHWDSHAYGSAVWLVLVAIAAVLVTDWADTVVLTLILWRGPVKKSHFPDVDENGFYWYFTVVMGTLVTAVYTLVPRL